MASKSFEIELGKPNFPDVVNRLNAYYGVHWKIDGIGLSLGNDGLQAHVKASLTQTPEGFKSPGVATDRGPVERLKVMWREEIARHALVRKP